MSKEQFDSAKKLLFLVASHLKQRLFLRSSLPSSSNLESSQALSQGIDDPISDGYQRETTSGQAEDVATDVVIIRLSNPIFERGTGRPTDDWAYAIVANELERNCPDKVVLTRVFAESGGDESKAKALYIQKRVERLIDDARTLKGISSDQPDTFEDDQVLARNIKVELNTARPTDEWAYATVANELEKKSPDKAVWTRSFAESGGDDSRAKALYIQKRVERLVAQDHMDRRIIFAKRQALKAEQQYEQENNRAVEIVLLKAFEEAKQEQQKRDATQYKITESETGDQKLSLEGGGNRLGKVSLRYFTFALIALLSAVFMFQVINPASSSKPSELSMPELNSKADAGNVEAQVVLAMRYLTGDRVPKNQRNAVYWFQKAAYQGNADAQAELGRLYAIGEGVPKDNVRAKQLLQMAAEKGNARAQLSLGVLLIDHGDEKSGAKWVLSAAQQGEAFAQTYSGHLYRNGIGVPKNVPKGVEWLAKGASQGDQVAETQLGILYLAGDEVQKDVSKGLELLGKAAAKGNVEAQFNLGMAYTYGKKAGVDVPIDVTKGLDWLEKAVAQEHVPAMVGLGWAYQIGAGVPKNSLKAFELAQKASAKGNMEGQSNLAELYEKGEAVGQDTAKALELFKPPAAFGVIASQQGLARIYAEKGSVYYDPVLADAWLIVASATENEAVDNQRQRLEAHLTARQISEARQLAASWTRGALIVH